MQGCAEGAIALSEGGAKKETEEGFPSVACAVGHSVEATRQQHAIEPRSASLFPGGSSNTVRGGTRRCGRSDSSNGEAEGQNTIDSSSAVLVPRGGHNERVGSGIDSSGSGSGGRIDGSLANRSCEGAHY